MAPASKISRKVALDRLSSPEQIDTLLQVTPARDWLALAAVLALLSAAVVWGFIGTVTSKTVGRGVIVRAGGVQQVVAPGGGQVVEVRTTAGASVRAGDIVVLIAQPGTPSQSSAVRSPYGGQVVELKVAAGSLVQAGTPILSLQPEALHLEALLYIDSRDARRIEPGMAVQVSPASVRREEFGFIRARVVSVSEYPATEGAMLRAFDNPPLVRALSSGGPVTEIHVEMEPDPSNPGGFKWSSSRGAPIRLSGGTMISGEIVTDQKAPIDLVIPYFRETFGIR